MKVTDSSSGDETCDLSDLSELSISDVDEDDFYDDCLNVKQQPVPDDNNRPARASSSGQSVGLLRQMSSSQQNLNRDSGASQSGPQIVSIFSEREEPTRISSGNSEQSLLRQMYTSQLARDDTSDSSQPGPVYTVSLFGERERSPHMSRIEAATSAYYAR